MFHDDLDWSNDRNELLIVSLFFKEGHYSFSPQKYSLSEFKELIKSHSGGPVSIGSKGLIYGTSRLECSLSKTDSLYPGDADLLLLNEDNKAVCILEFKNTHYPVLSRSNVSQTIIHVLTGASINAWPY